MKRLLVILPFLFCIRAVFAADVVVDGAVSIGDAPAENETFFNVGLLNSRMAALQSRIEQLEKELAAAKGGK